MGGNRCLLVGRGNARLSSMHFLTTRGMSRLRIDFGRIGVDLGIGVALALVWFGLGALMLWPFEQAALCGHFVKGYPLLVGALIGAMVVCLVVHRVFRMESDPASDAFVITNVLVSGLVQAGWAAFVALEVAGVTPGATLGLSVVAHFVGFVASYVTTATTGAFFQGGIYKTACIVVSAGAYVVFAIWPGAGRAVYGWFFGM